MDSPHPHFGYPHSIHPGNPGSPGPGAIGQPTSLYTHTLHPVSRKEDDLGLTNLLAQVRFDRNTAAAAGQEYGARAIGEGRWDEWSRSSRGDHGGMTLGNGNLTAGLGGGGPRTAPLFPSSASDPPPIAFPAPTPTAGDSAAQALHHMTALQSLLGPMTKAAEEVEKLKKEVEMWKNDWHKVGEEKRGLERALKEAQDKANVVDNKAAGTPFSVVLIDGDGLIFQDTQLQAGYQGGLTAARKLLSSLPSMHSHASISPTSQNFGADIMLDTADAIAGGNGVKGEKELGVILVNVFLNKSGLGQTLINAKIVSDWKAYNSFFEGLSAAHELISVIDVGPGKEAADAKIREHLRLYAKNSQCEMIVLGASHDNGYANILSSLQTENRLSKLLLLKGYTDLAGQLRQYSSRVVTIPDLFRITKVPLSFSSIAAQPATPVSAPKKANKAPPTATTASTPGDTPLQSPGSVEVFDWKEVSSGKKGVPGVSKASKGNKANEGKNEGKGGKGKKKNNGNKRVYSVRQLDPRPCHTYYLSERACRGDACEYAHHYDLNDEEIEDLRRLAKEMVCPYVKNNKCHYSEEDCVYGHFCPRGEECKFGESCRFYPLPNGHGELDD